jgi:hypothetical protein
MLLNLQTTVLWFRLSIQYEFESICRWAENNKLMLNKTKTKEMVIRRPNPRNLNPPPPLLGIERVTLLTLLGVIPSDGLSCNRM